MYKVILFCFALFSIHLLPAQNCQDCRLAAMVYDDVEITTIKYGEGVNSTGSLQELYMDIYQAVGDTHSNRPVMVFAFGGGFVQGSKEEVHVRKTCEYLAKSGYVAVGIDYRIGFNILATFPNPINELMRVFFRAMQDMRGAVQYMKYEADVMGNPYRIDTNSIIIGGASAGSITALLTAYCDKAEEFEEMGSLSAIDELGGFQSSSGLQQGYNWRPAGVFNIAGALVNKDWIEQGDPPLVSVHGTDDTTVPIEGGNFDLIFTEIGLEGSAKLHERGQEVGICHYLNALEGKGHPSNSWPDSEYDGMMLKGLPMFKAVARHKSFCCKSELIIEEMDTITVDSGESISLYYDLLYEAGGEQFQWCQNPCGISSQEPGIDVTVTSEITILLMAVSDRCIEADGLVLLPRPAEPVGLHLSPNENNIEIGPIPFKDQLIMNVPDDYQNATVRIIDLQGRVLSSSPLAPGTNSLNTPQLSRGHYFLQITSDHPPQTYKIEKN